MCFTSKDVIEILFSFIVTCSTVVYAILTWKLVKETKKQRRAITEPIIDVGLQRNEEDEHIFELYVVNLGFGIATNIKFKILKDFEIGLGLNKKLSEIGFFKNGIRALSPNKKYKTVISELLGNSPDKFNTTIGIEVIYDTPTESNKKLVYNLNFSEYADVVFTKKNATMTMKLLIQSIEELSKNIKDTQK